MGEKAKMERTMETAIVSRGYMGIMEKNMEVTIVYRGYIGIMAKRMETTIVGLYRVGLYMSPCSHLNPASASLNNLGPKQKP